MGYRRRVRIILDPNQNAFGQQKMGLPNIPVAKELNEMGNKSSQIKWNNTIQSCFILENKSIPLFLEGQQTIRHEISRT